MMSTLPSNYNSLLDDAASAIFTDDRELLRASLDSVGDQTPELVAAWLFKAWACESLSGIETALQQVLEIDPEHPVALAGLNFAQGIKDEARQQLTAKEQAEETERIRIEEEERARAEAVARRQAEEQAKIEAEKRRVEEARRVQAIEQARREAEEAARIQTERRQAEEAQRARAELEAQIVAAEQARREAESAELARLAELAELAEQDELPEKDEQRHPEIEDTAQPATNDLHIADPNQADPAGDSPTLVGGPDAETAMESEVKASVDSLVYEVDQEVRHLPLESAGQNITAPIEASISPSCILAVDDSPTIRKLVSLALSQSGYEVITAEDGVEALSILAKRLPDLILSDINMPKLGGYKLCKFVKKHDRTKHIPFIMLSGNDGVFDKMRGKMSGCNAFLTKPFEAEDLVDIVGSHLAAVTH